MSDIAGCSIWAMFTFWALIFWQYIRELRPEHARCPETLRQRMCGYSSLKHKTCLDTRAARPPAAEFEVLLGILKKVEQKNSAMATLWALIAGGVMTTLVALPDPTDAVIIMAVMSSVIPFLVLSILGTKQIDNVSLRAQRRRTGPETPTDEQILLGDLMRDALAKEELLWFSQKGAILFVCYFPVYFVLWMEFRN